MLFTEKVTKNGTDFTKDVYSENLWFAFYC